MTRFNWFICWQVLAVAYNKIMSCGLPFNTTKWSDNPHNNTNQQTTQLSIFTQQHIKTVQGLVKYCPNFLPQSI